MLPLLHQRQTADTDVISSLFLQKRAGATSYSSAKRNASAPVIRRAPCSYVCLEKEEEGAAEAMEETEAAAEEEERLLRKIM